MSKAVFSASIWMTVLAGLLVVPGDASPGGGAAGGRRPAGGRWLAGWRRGRRLVDVRLEPHVEVGPGQGMDLEGHQPMT